MMAKNWEVMTMYGAENNDMSLLTGQTQPAAVVENQAEVQSNVQAEVAQEENFEAHQAKIMVFGVGGGGCNTVNRLTSMDIQGAATVATNTDSRHLTVTNAHKKILLGKTLTRGLGAGGYPDVGKKSAEESKSELKEMLQGCDLLFITCGLGGGTGTGAAPMVAQYAKDMGAIVIAAVTLPFQIEGARIIKAEEGLDRLRQVCDTVIVIENQKLVELAGNRPIKEAFGVADTLISTMIKGITETISQPSLVNLDYADVKAILKAGGVATIGYGEAEGKNRAKEAIAKALNHPLLNVDYTGATGALIQIIGSDDMQLEEITAIGEAVAQDMNPNATVMWGARIVPENEGKLQVITIITGVSSPYILGKAATSATKVSNELGLDVIV
jgi:cell division protein FtsZ